jgi:hypothetical protein
MKRIIFCILILTAVLIVTQRKSEAFSLNYVSGEVQAYTLLDESSDRQDDPSYANSSQINDNGKARTSAHVGGEASGYHVSLYSTVDSFLDYYWTSAQCHTRGVNGFILFQVSASPEDLENPMQIVYEYDYSKNLFFSSSSWDPYYIPLIITLNGVTKVNDTSFYNQYSSGFLDVNDGDIIGLSCGLLADNICYAGIPRAGYMDAMLHVSLSPIPLPSASAITLSSASQVPLPSTLLFLGSGLLSLAGWRRFRKG